MAQRLATLTPMGAPEFGKRLAAARRRAGYATQQDLAARLGISRTSVSNWETGRHKPHPGELARLREVLDLGSDEPESSELAARTGYESLSAAELASQMHLMAIEVARRLGDIAVQDGAEERLRELRDARTIAIPPDQANGQPPDRQDLTVVRDAE